MTRRPTRLARITAYVTEHPGCTVREVVGGTGLFESNVYAALPDLLVRDMARRDESKPMRLWPAGIPDAEFNAAVEQIMTDYDDTLRKLADS